MARRLTAVVLTAATTGLGLVLTPTASADAECGAGAPPPGAASKDVSATYGQPATLWLTDTVVGITTPDGYGEAPIRSASPLPRRALLVDAQQDGSHQLIVDTGRDAQLFTVSGCTITRVVDGQGDPFLFDLGHRRGTGDGVGCSDLGDGPHLVQLLQQRHDMTVRRTEVDLTGATATTGRSDTVTATSDDDPVWTSAQTISCGDLTIDSDGLTAAP